MPGRKRLDIGVLQDIETFGIGLHQAVFDAVMNHLDEVPGADRAGMEIALLDAGVASLSAFGAGDVTEAGRERLEDRIETLDHLLVAADHHAVAALDAPDAAGCADVDVVDAAIPELVAPADI